MSEVRGAVGKPDDIAIIGMACRFPGARSPEAFWANLRAGVSSIRVLSDEELLAAGATRAEIDDPNYVKACPVLDDIDKFDAAFFGFSPRDAAVMDPAHRIFLELAWEAVENAGYAAVPEEGPVGVFAGAGAPLYMAENLQTNPELMRSMGDFLVRHTGNDMNFLATRVSYEMDLRGPSMNVQTACSSALVSAHVACQSLLRGECEMALAGGATVIVPQVRGYEYRDGEILSPDGKCRPFDAKSAGTVFGSGAGVLVLKRLKDALDHGDTIHAVIKGSAVNNDGAMKVGYLAPGVEGQAVVVRSALADAGVPAESIGYIEAHGTGTLVGDPIEVEALIEAYRAETDKRGFCALGSVKSNIGHLGEAAAAAALIKAVMALKHRELPPSLGYETPNPAIDFEASPFFVNADLRPWQAIGPRRCGVTALGAGGTNCHLILEEAPPSLPGEGERPQQLLVLSAKTRTALEAAAGRLADALEADPDLDLADAAYTLAVGRRSMPHRRALAAADRDEAIARLRETAAKPVVGGLAQDGRVATVFMFPGGGAQYAGMGRELYETEPVYRDAIDACLEIVGPMLGDELKGMMYPPAGGETQATLALERPSLALPALFSAEYAMARLFQSWGLKPDALIGHSLGEYVAAHLAGVFSLKDALRLVMKRGELFEAVEPGGMLAVPLSEAELTAVAPSGLSIAAVNAPELCVASGPKAAIAELTKILAARDVEATAIHIDVAAHSAMLEPVLGEFRDLCRTIGFQPPKTPFVSNVTGDWITPAQATDPDYWVRHLRSTVRFAAGLKTLAGLGQAALIEVGPGRTLSMLAKAQAEPAKHAFNSMRHPNEAASDLGFALTCVGRAWCAGAMVDWHAFYDGQLRNRVPLPAYPFESRSYWVQPGARTVTGAAETLAKKPDMADWFASPTLMQAPLLAAPAADPERAWLVIADQAAEAGRLAKGLEPQRVVIASAGRRLETGRGGDWRFDLDDKNQHAEVLRRAEAVLGRVDEVVFVAMPTPGGAATEAHAERSFLRPTYLAQALAEMARPPRLTVITHGLSGLEGQSLDPLQALALGPVYVAPREVETFAARCVDLPAGLLSSRDRRAILTALVEELRTTSTDRFVALTASGRWVQDLRPLPLPEPGPEAASWVREGGVYLITGGLGGIGLEIAEHLARTAQVKLALVSRSGLPEESQWDGVLEESPLSGVAARIARVRALRALGAQVMVVEADLADSASLRTGLQQVRAGFGPLNGVIHAAGLMDDEPLLAKTREAMMRVLSPKVLGALALDTQVTEPLDAFVLFSSVASLLGLPGQVDYTAANAFLDAFARERSTRAPGRTVVINWSAWADVGMAAAAYRAETDGPAALAPAAHPALDGYAETPTGRVFTATFDADKSWLVAEHRVKGGSRLLPGTAFVELMRAAYCEGRRPGPVELANLTFVEPFQVAEGETRKLMIELRHVGAGVEFALRPGDRAADFPIVTGEARDYAGATPKPLDLAAIGARCMRRIWISLDGFLDQDFMDFGPRWANMRQVRYGAGEALVELSLPAAFAGEAGAYGLHPAMLDMATGGAQALIEGADLARDFYVPLGYERICVFGPMPAQALSHVRLAQEAPDGLARFDVTLADPQGRVFAEIERFTMKRVDARSAIAASSARAKPAEPSAAAAALAEVLREGVRAEEGVRAFARIMAQPRLVQAIASSVDVPAWLRRLERTQALHAAESEAGGGFERPELAVDYAAPAPGLETALAKIWSELLGVKQVGAHDDFFDLGGNSLVGVRMFARMRRELGVRLQLSELLGSPTISLLAQRLRAAAPDLDGALESGEATAERIETASPLQTTHHLVPIARAGSKRPLYIVHGAGGNVLFLANFGRAMPDRPIFGFQALGIHVGEAPDKSIAEMADRYVAELRAHGPGPYMLGGFSGGSIIALEMARRLQALGEQVDCAVLFDGVPPGKAREGYPWNLHLLGHLLRRGPRAIAPYVRNSFTLSLRRLLHAGPSLIKPYLSGRTVERLRRFTPAWIHWDARVEDMDRTLGFGGRAAGIVALDEHFAQVSAKHPMGVYGVDTIVIKADLVWPGHAQDYYWGPYLTGKLTLSTTPGDHNTIFHPENAQRLASVLAPLLDAYDAPQAAPGAAEAADQAMAGEPDASGADAAPARVRLWS